MTDYNKQQAEAQEVTSYLVKKFFDLHEANEHIYTATVMTAACSHVLGLALSLSDDHEKEVIKSIFEMQLKFAEKNSAAQIQALSAIERSKDER